MLPALLPNRLLNGTSGIGVGVTTGIPAFTPVSVIKLMIRLLSGEALVPADYAKGLEFHFQYGGQVTKTPKNKKAILTLMNGTKGSVEWESPLEVDQTKKEVRIWKFAPEVNPIPLIEGKTDKNGKKTRPGIKDWDEVGRVIASKGVSYTVKARRELNMNEFNQMVDRIKKATTTKISYEVYVTERIPDPDAGEGKYKVNFITCSIPELFIKWLKWRCKLEARSLDWRIKQVMEHIDYVKLLIYAADNLAVIFKALKAPDSASYLVNNLKLTLIQANQILDLQVRRLSKLDQSKLKVQLAQAKVTAATLRGMRKDPPGQVKLYMEQAVSAFSAMSQFSGTHQFEMKNISVKTTDVDPESEV